MIFPKLIKSEREFSLKSVLKSEGKNEVYFDYRERTGQATISILSPVIQKSKSELGWISL